MAWENVRPHSLLQQRWKLRCQEVQLRTTQEPEQTEQQGWTRTQGSPVVVQCISPPTGPSPEARGDVASTPALCGDPLGNAYQQARPTGVCWCWRPLIRKNKQTPKPGSLSGSGSSLTLKGNIQSHRRHLAQYWKNRTLSIPLHIRTNAPISTLQTVKDQTQTSSLSSESRILARDPRNRNPLTSRGKG